MTRKIRQALPFLSVLALIMLCAVLLSCPSSARADTIPIHSDKVNGLISNLDFTFADVDWDIDCSWDDTLPSISLSISLKIGAKGDFDLQIQGGTLPEGISEDDVINASTPGIFTTIIREDILDFLPKTGWGGEVPGKLFAGATHPADVQGNFDVRGEIRLSTRDGLTFDAASDFNYRPPALML